MMSPMETDEFVTKVKAFSEEQKILTIRQMPDNLLWSEIYSRFKRMDRSLKCLEDVMTLTTR